MFNRIFTASRPDLLFGLDLSRSQWSLLHRVGNSLRMDGFERYERWKVMSGARPRWLGVRPQWLGVRPPP